MRMDGNSQWHDKFTHKWGKKICEFKRFCAEEKAITVNSDPVIPKHSVHLIYSVHSASLPYTFATILLLSFSYSKHSLILTKRSKKEMKTKTKLLMIKIKIHKYTEVDAWTHQYKIHIEKLFIILGIAKTKRKRER